MKLILASASSYRRELLSRLQLPFEVIPANVDETPHQDEAIPALASRLAALKAETVLAQHPDALVIGCDQVGTLDGLTPIGKPGTPERARSQLMAASGRTMQFHTALALRSRAHPPIDERVCVRVTFRALTTAEIERYLAMENVLDCAGSARCEGLGIRLLSAIETDDPTALIGLPLIRLCGHLRHLGLDPLAPAASVPDMPS
ncbi:MAG: Maf family nucleotide pyrophosphatase [Lautropia sp.]|nr:Maf family nucleotide pyrophosphatase [Lautropia sp.]